MTRPTTAPGAVPARPAPPAHPAVPRHLVGTRAAIFHLLRNAASLEEAARLARPAPPPAAPAPAPVSAPVSAPVAAASVPPVRMRAPAPAMAARDSAFQDFLYGDQFEFRSQDARTPAPQNMAAPRDQRAPVHYRLQGRSLTA